VQWPYHFLEPGNHRKRRKVVNPEVEGPAAFLPRMVALTSAFPASAKLAEISSGIIPAFVADSPVNSPEADKVFSSSISCSIQSLMFTQRDMGTMQKV